MKLLNSIIQAEAELHTAHCVKNLICKSGNKTLTTVLAVTEDAITRLGLELKELRKVEARGSY